MRIYKDQTYFVRSQRGISGFQQWGVYDYGITSGASVQSRRRHTSGSFDLGMDPGACGNLNAGERFRLDDGHLPDYQPRATFEAANKWVHDNPGRVAWIVSE